MTAHEFEALVTADGQLSVPSDVAPRLPKGEKVRVLVLVEETDEDAWRRLTSEQFLKGYAEGDAIYDQVSTG